jgi:hypothetical protein
LYIFNDTFLDWDQFATTVNTTGENLLKVIGYSLQKLIKDPQLRGAECKSASAGG